MAGQAHGARACGKVGAKSGAADVDGRSVTGGGISQPVRGVQPQGGAARAARAGQRTKLKSLPRNRRVGELGDHEATGQAADIKVGCISTSRIIRIQLQLPADQESAFAGAEV